MTVSFELTDEQRELQQLAHDFAERELRPIAQEWDAKEDFLRTSLRTPPGSVSRRTRSPRSTAGAA